MKRCPFGAVLFLLAGCGGSSGHHTSDSGLAGSYAGTATYYATAGGAATSSGLVATGSLTAQSGAYEFSFTVQRVSSTSTDRLLGTLDATTGRIALADVVQAGSDVALTGTGAETVANGVVTITLDAASVDSTGPAQRYVLVLKKRS